ncbi:hypothetical protein SLEP1_g42529 [Rubroshorea leprosula]|uniref:SANT domain-containing protein n=1 Tax=Rubroshorea leprosula TaxID=152421 RepID=A0AAV5LA31_9ROSI|nr:hypothetical protein SLEP1_g42529 [Rubroshorea leprosula]
MPPEPLPWDRKDFFKERKHERPESLARWKEAPSVSSYHHGPSRELTRCGSADFRRHPGHARQGVWHQFAGDVAHGFGPSRSADKIFEAESCRPFFSRGDGKYFRNGVRENRGSYSQRDWKVHTWETSNSSPNTYGRLDYMNNEQRSVDDILTYPPPAHSEFVNSCHQLHPKDQHDNKASGGNGLGAGLKSERENSVGPMEWKPLKWSRSGSLSSRGPGFSHSNGSKSLGGLDSSEGKAEFQQKNATPVQSPSGDAAACVTSAALSDETTSRKKPRLGWGEGLAKYEKKKVEGPDTSVNGVGTTISVSNQELNHSMTSNLADKSPRFLALSDCASPATPSSVGCSSSSGVEEKSFSKAINGDNDINESCGSPSLVPHNHLEGFTLNLEKLNVNSIADLGSSLNELLQPDDHCSVDSSFVQPTAINKLLLCKSDILKVLEMTESEIDLLENELKSLKCESGERYPCPAMPNSFPLEGNWKPCEEQNSLSNLVNQPSPLQIDQYGDAVLETKPPCNGVVEVVCADVKDGDIDSPGSATSKFTELSSVGKAVSPLHIVNQGENSRDLGALQPTTMNICVASGCSDVGTGISACKGGSMLSKIENNAQITESSNCYGIGENISYDVLLSANRELAKTASEVFNKILPEDHCPIEISRVLSNVTNRQNSFIREKFVMRKRELRLKERILTLKYRTFYYLWKEDIHSLSIRKFRAKSQKKSEVFVRATHSVYQKHRTSLRSAGNLSLVPTMEMINFVSKLLSESQVKDHRNSLKMPAMILDKKEKQLSRFVSSNGLIEDPCAVEKERSLINPWMSDEKDIFMDKLATFGKDFGKIASFLDHKTTADCVEFYYKNHKSDGFEKTKKLDLSKHWKSATSTYLVTSGKKWSRERNAASLDILGAASVIAAHAESRIGNQQMSSGRIFLRRCYESKRSRVEDGTTERSGSFGFTEDDRETAAVDVLAGICGSLSSEAMSSCITSSVDPGNSKWKSQKVDSVMKWTSTSDVTQNVDDDTCSDESCREPDPADWTDEEKSIFLQAFSSYGKDFSMISQCVRTRSQDQCRVFFSKVRKCLGLDLINAKARNMGTPLSDDANGDGNDMEDTSVLKSSVVAVDKLGSKVEDDLPCTATMNEEGSNPAGALNLQTSLNISEDNKEMGVLDHSNSEAVESVVSHVSWLADRPQPNCRSHGDVDDNNQQLESEPAQEIVALTDVETGKERGTKQCTSVGEVVDACPCNLNSETESKSLVQCSIKSFENKLMAQDPLLAKSKSDDQDEKCGADTVSQGFSFGPKVLHQVFLELDSPQKPTVTLAEEGSILADPNSKSQDSDGFPCDKMCNQDRMSSTHDFQDSRDKCGHKSVSGDEYTASNHAESSQISMLTISTKKEINVDTSSKQYPDVQSRLKSDMDEGGQYLTQDCYDKKCNNSISQSSVAALPFLSQSAEQTSDHPRAQLQSLSDTEKPCRNGNVKLFGQILNSSGDEDSKGTNLLKRGVKLSNSKLNGHHQVDGSSAVLKFDHHDYLGLENVPVSFGFWDGNRIQTGNPSLPDSSILMAKYPAATSKMEQQALLSAGKSNDLNSNDVSVISSMDIGSNGVVDYQLSRGLDGSKVQPFSLDVKKPRQEVLSEVQQRGFDAIPSLEHQGREMVGMNDLGRTRALAGGGSTGESDPVAALHHARIELYSGQNGGIIREEESRRGNGGISR